MILIYLIVILLAGALLAWITGKWNPYLATYHFTCRHCLLISLLLSYSIFKSDPSIRNGLLILNLTGFLHSE